MKTAKNASPATTHGYRLIFRGKNKSGKYLRAVRTVQVQDLNAAYYHLAEHGDKLASEIKEKNGFDVAYTNVFVPIEEGVSRISFANRLDLEVAA